MAVDCGRVNFVHLQGLCTKQERSTDSRSHWTTPHISFVVLRKTPCQCV